MSIPLVFCRNCFSGSSLKTQRGQKKMNKERSRPHLVDNRVKHKTLSTLVTVTNVADKRKATLTRVNTDG